MATWRMAKIGKLQVQRSAGGHPDLSAGLPHQNPLPRLPPPLPHPPPAICCPSQQRSPRGCVPSLPDHWTGPSSLSDRSDKNILSRWNDFGVGDTAQRTGARVHVQTASMDPLGTRAEGLWETARRIVRGGEGGEERWTDGQNWQMSRNVKNGEERVNRRC